MLLEESLFSKTTKRNVLILIVMEDALRDVAAFGLEILLQS